MRKDFELLDATHEQVLTGFKALCKTERKLHGEFLAFLNEIDQRRLYAGEGYSSLCNFIVSHLNYSESTALKRIQVARAAKKFPEIYYLIEDGEVSLSNLERVAPHLTHSNSDRLLKSICRKSVRSVEAMLATEFPKPDGKDRVTPLSEAKVEVRFTAPRAFAEHLEKAKAMLCRKYPKGRAAEVLGEALKVLLEMEEPQKERKAYQADAAIAEANVWPEAEFTTRYIPCLIRDEVWRRDKGACQFKSSNGHVCGETRFLEYDHVLPWALGGSSHSLENIRLLCRTHNQWLARNEFPYLARIQNGQ